MSSPLGPDCPPLASYLVPTVHLSLHCCARHPLAAQFPLRPRRTHPAQLRASLAAHPAYLVGPARGPGTRPPHPRRPRHLRCQSLLRPRYPSALRRPALPIPHPAKLELFRLPFLGWHLTGSGQIPSTAPMPPLHALAFGRRPDRETRHAPRCLSRRRTQHRRPHPAFLGGTFYVAIKAQVPIIPMAIVGTFDALPMNTFVIRPTPFRLIVGDPIPTTGLISRDMEALSTRVHQAISDLFYASSQLSRPTPQPDATDSGLVLFLRCVPRRCHSEQRGAHLQRAPGAPFKPSFGLGGVVDLSSALAPVLARLLSHAVATTISASNSPTRRAPGWPSEPSFGLSGVVDLVVALVPVLAQILIPHRRSHHHLGLKPHPLDAAG